MRQIKVLMADDDRTSQDFFEQICHPNLAVELTFVADGRQALLQGIAYKFDLMIFDRQLSLITGDLIVRQLRNSTNPNSTTPVILTSALCPTEQKALCSFDEAVIVLSKPVSRQEFLKAVETLVNGDGTYSSEFSQSDAECT